MGEKVSGSFKGPSSPLYPYLTRGAWGSTRSLYVVGASMASACFKL